MTDIKDVEQLFMHEVRALWSGEKMLTETIPMLVEKAAHPALKMGLAFHLAETDQHKVVLELICKQLGFEHEGVENLKMKSILEEGDRTMSGVSAGNELDELIIAGARRVEQYEIVAYRSAAHYAELMGYLPIASRLRLTLEEEQQADNKLKFIGNEVIGFGKKRTETDELVNAESDQVGN